MTCIKDSEQQKHYGSRMHSNWFNLYKVIRGSVTQAGQHTGPKNVWFDIIMDPTLPAHFEGDSEVISQILLNLMVNAVKCTKYGSLKLLAHGSPDDGVYHVGITIADRGKGMKQEELDALLSVPPDDENPEDDSRFYIYQSRASAQKLGGDLKASSWVGIGTDFTLMLPLRAATI